WAEYHDLPGEPPEVIWTEYGDNALVDHEDFLLISNTTYTFELEESAFTEAPAGTFLARFENFTLTLTPQPGSALLFGAAGMATLMPGRHPKRVSDRPPMSNAVRRRQDKEMDFHD